MKKMLNVLVVLVLGVVVVNQVKSCKKKIINLKKKNL